MNSHVGYLWTAGLGRMISRVHMLTCEVRFTVFEVIESGAPPQWQIGRGLLSTKSLKSWKRPLSREA